MSEIVLAVIIGFVLALPVCRVFKSGHTWQAVAIVMTYVVLFGITTAHFRDMAAWELTMIISFSLTCLRAYFVALTTSATQPA